MNYVNQPATFDSNEMIACKTCGRTSPPNRTSCLYCGKPLELDQIQFDIARLNLREVENWESGFNLILPVGLKPVSVNEREKAAKILGFSAEFLAKIFEANEALPIVRLGSLQDAKLAKAKLEQLHLEAVIVSDDELHPKEPARRLRKIEFEHERICLTLFNSGETVFIPNDKLTLIVCGSVFEKKIETIEKYSKSKESKTLSSDETAKDSKIIDIYSDSDLIGFRILMHGFDFSPLGNDMSFLATENMDKLFETIKEIAPNADAVESYNNIRELLAYVWTVDQIKESQGTEKKGVRDFNIKRETRVSNANQFTKFSRLKRHLL